MQWKSQVVCLNLIETNPGRIQELRGKNTKQPRGMLGAIDQKCAVMGSKPWSDVITDGGAEPAEVLEFAYIAKERWSGLLGI